MTDLSPAAQAVLNAYNSRWDNNLAAALRAAAKHCVYSDDFGDEFIKPLDLLVIAAELDAADHTSEGD